MKGPAHETWTTRRLLTWMAQAFADRGLDSPRLMAEMLLSHAIGCDRLHLYMDQDRPASPMEREILRDLVRRAVTHEPVQYLVGEAMFYGLDFEVGPGVLIPRPSTATIVDQVLSHARASHGAAGARGDGVLVLDVATGSGNIAIALLKNLPGARAIGSDISERALEWASHNARRHGVADRLELVCGDLLEPLRAHPVAGVSGAADYLVSNPPYIPDDEWEAVEPNVKDHEPSLALRGGVDGLDLVRRLIEHGPETVRPGGLVLIEAATARIERALELMGQNPRIARARVEDDIDGLARVVVGEVGG